MAIEGNVKIPVIGTVSKKGAVAAGVGVGLIGVIWYVRSRRASSSGTATGTPAGTAGQQTDPAGNTGVIDPATGYVQGSPEDQQALSAAQSAAAPYDTSGLGTGLGGYYYGSGGSTQTSSNPPGPGNFADNAEWAQYAENYMVTTLAADPAATGSALGAYISGSQVTSGQRDLIEEAIAIAGQPPQAGPNGYPPNINLGGGKPPPKPGSNVKVPNVVGEPAGEAHNKIAAAGLTPIADPAQKPGDKVTSTSPKAGASVAKGTRVLITASAVEHGKIIIGVGDGPVRVDVPDVAGETAGQAHNELVNAGLRPTAARGQKPTQRVKGTTPRAGSRVPRGSKIQILT